ncbi:unnamed protein product, partial [Amoebophrya sp. A25]
NAGLLLNLHSIHLVATQLRKIKMLVPLASRDDEQDFSRSVTTASPHTAGEQDDREVKGRATTSTTTSCATSSSSSRATKARRQILDKSQLRKNTEQNNMLLLHVLEVANDDQTHPSSPSSSPSSRRYRCEVSLWRSYAGGDGLQLAIPVSKRSIPSVDESILKVPLLPHPSEEEHGHHEDQDTRGGEGQKRMDKQHCGATSTLSSRHQTQTTGSTSVWTTSRKQNSSASKIVDQFLEITAFQGSRTVGVMTIPAMEGGRLDDALTGDLWNVWYALSPADSNSSPSSSRPNDLKAPLPPEQAPKL